MWRTTGIIICMEISKEIFCFHFWGDRLSDIPEKTKIERFEDFISSNVSLGRYIVMHHRLRPGMLVKVKPMFATAWSKPEMCEEFVGIYMEQLRQPRAGERWFVVFHDGKLKEILDYEVHEVLIEEAL